MAEPAAILTIEAASPGGVPALVDAIYVLMKTWGYEPTVYRAQFAEGNLSLPQRIATTLRQWKARRVEERGLPTVLVPAPPVPLWLFYAVPHFLLGNLLGAYECIFVASGSAHVALPLALRGIPYVLWIATLYEDELRAKMSAGDKWAQRVLNSPTWPILQAQERWVLNKAARIMALSPHTAARIREWLPNVADRVETVLYPVDTTRFHPHHEAHSVAAEGEYLLLAARITDPRKNVPLLLRAFALVKQQRPHLRLVLVGEAPDDHLLSLVAALSLEEAVIFRGVVPPDELLRLYQGAALFVLPSAQEGLGIVVLEALACGTPVVTLASGGPEGIVIDGLTGRVVVEVDDPAALAQGILDLLDDPDRPAMRARCAAFAQEHFAYPLIAEKLRAAYEAVRNAPRGLSRIGQVITAVWVMFVLATYVLRQMTLHWASIQQRIIDPLLGGVP